MFRVSLVNCLHYFWTFFPSCNNMYISTTYLLSQLKSLYPVRPYLRLLNYECLVLLQVTKCFVLVQTFCVEPKIYLRIVPVTNIFCQTILHSVRLVFVMAQVFLKRLQVESIFWTSSKHFGTCKRTRHKCLLLKFSCTVMMQLQNLVFFWNIFFIRTRINFQFQNEKNPVIFFDEMLKKKTC